MKEGIKSAIEHAPRKPGVYLWKRADGRILYVGKANDLLARLKSYLTPADHKTKLLVDQAGLVETIVTKTESEALLLEDALVKQNQPRFNVRLRDDKRYPYLKVTAGEEYPRIQVVRRVEADGSRYFGPFTDGSVTRKIISLVGERFGIRSCNYDVRRLTRPCIKYSMGKCAAPYTVMPKKDYDRVVEHTCRFLAGDYKRLQREVKKEIKKASKFLNFERAAELKKTLDILDSFSAPQDIAGASLPDMDVLGYGTHERKAAISQMKVRNHRVVAVLTHPLKGERAGDAGEAMKSFVSQHYTSADMIPRFLYVSASPEDKKLLEDKLTAIRGRKVEIRQAHRGQKSKLAQLAVENSIHSLAQDALEKGAMPRTQALKKALGLASLPSRIEGYDISNLGEKAAVGSMVVFTDGAPDKREYRRFRIRWKAEQDDPRHLAEVVQRRFTHPEWAAPDLVLLDGGKPQLNACLPRLPAGIPAIGLAKRNEEVFLPGRKEPLTLPKDDPGLLLLKAVRDEAHRFAKAYHAKRREKEFIK